MKGFAVSIVGSFDDADPGHVANLMKAMLMLNGIRAVVSDPVVIDDVAGDGNVETFVEGAL